jgi:hypothetical protein
MMSTLFEIEMELVVEDLETFDVGDDQMDADWDTSILFEEVHEDEITLNDENDDIENAERIWTT